MDGDGVGAKRSKGQFRGQDGKDGRTIRMRIIRELLLYPGMLGGWRLDQGKADQRRPLDMEEASICVAYAPCDAPGELDKLLTSE